jgi:transposase-like protein
MEETSATTEPQPFRGEDWFDPLETAVRGRIRGFIEEILEAELEGALQRRRYDRRGTTRGHRHGHRERQLVGTFGPVTLSVPRARLAGADGKTSEWRNRTIPAYKRLT